jgi:spore maturation protein CgeB
MEVSRKPLILYVGPLEKGGTCLERLLALRELGYEIRELDTSAVWSGFSGLVGRVSRRLLIGPPVWKFNEALLRLVTEIKPDILWFDKVMLVTAYTLREIKRRTPAVLVHYNPDDPFGRYRGGWRLFIKAIPEYDLHFVARDNNAQELMACGAKRVERLFRGYSARLHCPENDLGAANTQHHEVGFIGSYEKERTTVLRYLADENIPLALWGRPWSQHMKRSGTNLTIYPEGVYSEAYVAAIRSCKINLNFLRAGNRDSSNSRAYEIPACGAFMLSERSDELQSDFREGVEAEFFSSKEEAADKIKFYMREDSARIAIAARGLERCIESGYSYEGRMRKYMGIVRELWAGCSVPSGRGES